MAIITLTNEDAGQIPLKTSEIARIRKMTDSERDFHDATTRVDYAHTLYVKENPEDVAHMVATVPDGVPTLGRVTIPNGWPVWFDAAKARGPLPVPGSAPASSINSAVEIGGKLQYVRNTPQEIHDLIEGAGGNALPVPSERSVLASRSAEAAPPPDKVWDYDVPEMMGNPPVS